MNGGEETELNDNNIHSNSNEIQNSSNDGASQPVPTTVTIKYEHI